MFPLFNIFADLNQSLFMYCKKHETHKKENLMRKSERLSHKNKKKAFNI